MDVVEQGPAVRSRGRAVLGGSTAMVLVGGSAAVSAVLVTAPLLTVQALRYAAASAVLAVLATATGRRLHRPRGTEWSWLVGVTATGLLMFNVALVLGSRHAEPAVFGVAVASVPLVLAVLGPLLDGGTTSGRVRVAAVLVTLGAVLVVGFGRTDAVGALWAVVLLGCEAAFTLLAVPLLGRHGPWGVSVHTTWLAAVVFGAGALVLEGPAAAATLTGRDLAAGAYLALGVTALAFVCWYGSVARLGAGTAGLLTGLAPVSAAVAGVALGGPWPGWPVWVGVAVVVTGLALGLGTGTTPGTPVIDPSVRRAGAAGPRRA